MLSFENKTALRGTEQSKINSQFARRERTREADTAENPALRECESGEEEKKWAFSNLRLECFLALNHCGRLKIR